MAPRALLALGRIHRASHPPIRALGGRRRAHHRRPPRPATATAPASASCAWPRPTPTPDSKPPHSAPSPSAPVRCAPSSPSPDSGTRGQASSTASTSRRPTTPPNSPCPPTTTTSAHRPTSTEPPQETPPMLTHPTIDKLHQLRCPGMAAALAEPLHSPLCDALSFEACPRVPSGERLGLLADRELTLRDDRRMSSRLRRARLRHPNAGIEDIDSRHPRRLDKALIHSLASALAARTPQRPHHRSHRRLPPSARIGGRQVLAPVHSLTTPAATASPPCPCASPGSCTNSPSPAATAATPSSSPPSPKPTSSSSTTSDSPSSTPTTAATSSELLEDRYASRSTLVTSQLPLAQWQTARRPHPRRRHPRPTRPQRLQAPTQGRLHAKTSLRLDPCRSLHGIIIAPRRFAPTGDRLDRIR